MNFQLDSDNFPGPFGLSEVAKLDGGPGAGGYGSRCKDYQH